MVVYTKSAIIVFQTEQKEHKCVLQCALIVSKIENQDFMAGEGSIYLP